MSEQAPRKFAFDTEFDAEGGVAYAAPRPKRHFTAEEVEAIRQGARAEGERAALTRIQAQQMALVAEIARACSAAIPALAAVAHEHRVGAARLAMACGRAIADAALARVPEAPLQAAVEALARELECAPRLIVQVSPEAVAQMQPVMDEAAARAGFAGAIQVRGDASVGSPAAFILDFGDGSASFDPAAAAERVSQALEAALAAEGLHAEPLIPG